MDFGAVDEHFMDQEVKQSSTEQSKHSDAQDAACLYIEWESCGVDGGSCGPQLTRDLERLERHTTVPILFQLEALLTHTDVTPPSVITMMLAPCVPVTLIYISAHCLCVPLILDVTWQTVALVWARTVGGTVPFIAKLLTLGGVLGVHPKAPATSASHVVFVTVVLTFRAELFLTDLVLLARALV